MPKILFVINAKAGSGTVDDFEQALHDALARLPERAAWQVETLLTDTPEAMRETLRDRFEISPPDVLGVVGGDGSVMEVLPVLVEFPAVRLALIPYGTGNLLAANLGLPSDFEQALQTAFGGQVRRIDLGRIGSRYFALLAGAGVVAEIMENTESRHKQLMGPWAYLLQGIRTIMRSSGSLFHLRVDGRKIRVRAVSVVVSNAASLMRPCPALTPEAEPDDGLLDVCVIKARGRRDYVPALLEILRGAASPDSARRILSFQARTLRIEAAPPLKVQADGNIIGTTPVDIDVLRSRLQILVPHASVETGFGKGDETEAAKARQERSLRDLLGGAAGETIWKARKAESGVQ